MNSLISSAARFIKCSVLLTILCLSSVLSGGLRPLHPYALSGGRRHEMLHPVIKLPNAASNINPGHTPPPAHPYAGRRSGAMEYTSTFEVTNTSDTGTGSLRWAIESANHSAGQDLIIFNILGNATIRPLKSLPVIQEAVIIDGTTQPGYTGTPIVQLDGSLAGTEVNGLTIWSDNCAVRGLSITGFLGVLQVHGDSTILNGIGIAVIGGGNNLIEGNFIGLETTGTAAEGNDFGVAIFGIASHNVIGGLTIEAQNRISGNHHSGIYISPDNTGGNSIVGNLIGMTRQASGTWSDTIGNREGGIFIQGLNDTIGGLAAGARNIISGNNGVGIELDSPATGNSVYGNYIGTDVQGKYALGNIEGGIWVDNAAGNDIAGNIISGNDGAGIYIEYPGATGNRFTGNFIGTSADVSSLVPNYIGIVIDSAYNNIIGGTGFGEANVISGNTTHGIQICYSSAGNKIQGNIIGTDPANLNAWGNGYDGVNIAGSQNIIGGRSAGAGNIICNNQDAGIYDTAGNGNLIRMNSIYANSGLGIDLAPRGINPNGSPGTPGPNNLQNYPILDSIRFGVNDTIYGRLSSTPNRSYVIDFYSGDKGNSSGNGEGKTWLDSLQVETGDEGLVSFIDLVPSAGVSQVLAATATDQGGNTSEFSPDLAGVVITVLKPLKDSLFVAGKTDTIRWSSPQVDSVDISYTIASDKRPTPFVSLVNKYPAQTGQYVWNPIPADILSRKCQILIRSSKNQNIYALSDPFRIKPYVLTRINSKGDYVRFDPAVDGWRFDNSEDNLWPQLWWQGFDYFSGRDPNTEMFYPSYFPNAPYFTIPSDFPDWPLYVNAYTKNQCYYPNSGIGSFIYNERAVEAWGSIKGVWGGSCYGMATMSYLIFDGYMNPPGGAKNLFGYIGPDDATRELINMYFIYQFGVAQQAFNDTKFETPIHNTISELKTMFTSDKRDDMVLSLVANGLGHAVNAYRLGESAAYDSIFVYDNDSPADRTKYILVNNFTNLWSYQFSPGNVWSRMNKGVYLAEPISLALTAPQVKVISSSIPAAKIKSTAAAFATSCMAYNTPNASIRITNTAGDSMGYNQQIGEWFTSMSSGHPIIPKIAAVHPPIGYYLPLNSFSDNYTATIKNLTDPVARFSFFTDSAVYSYHRSDGDSTQTDHVVFGDGLTFTNTDSRSKNLLLKAIVSSTDGEHSFQLMNYTANSNNSVRLELSGHTGLKLRNTGGPKLYDLKLVNNTANGGKTYLRKGMVIDTNSTNMLIPSWNGNDSEQLKILIDHGNKGSYDDSALISALGSPSVLGPTPYLDLTFGNQGTIDMFLPGDLGEWGMAGAIQPDGKILEAGRSIVPHYNASGIDTSDAWTFFVARFTAAGKPDTMFGTKGVARTQIIGGTFLEDYANAMAIQPDGKIVLAGSSTAGVSAANTTTAFALARFNPDGSLDNTFGTNGTVRTQIAGGNNYDAAFGVIIQPDGKIVAAGSSGTWSFYSNSWSNMQFAVARYNADGSLDATFGPHGGTVRAPIFGGSGQSDWAASVARQIDGKIVVGGYSQNNYIDGFAVARFDSSGGLDPSFGPNGGTRRILTDSMADGEGNTVIIQPDQKIVIAGQVLPKTSANCFAAIRLNPDATLDSTFGTFGVAQLHLGRQKNAYDFGVAAVLQSDGKIVEAGKATDSAGLQSFGVVRFTQNGFPDSTFGLNGSIVNQIGGDYNTGRWVGIQPDRKIVVTGYSDGKTYWLGTYGITTSSITLARYMPQTSFIVEGVKTPLSSIPTAFNLYQNYPNPFNPATVIRYQLPAESRVRLTIYNMLGQAVATLVDRIEQAGEKEVRWNAASTASGVYFYRIEAMGLNSPHKEFVQIRKMLLIK